MPFRGAHLTCIAPTTTPLLYSQRGMVAKREKEVCETGEFVSLQKPHSFFLCQEPQTCHEARNLSGGEVVLGSESSRMHHRYIGSMDTKGHLRHLLGN
jgi:hypothetical protein